jgi:ribosomal protein S18 acetylase RimI-like enzyme
MSDDDVEIRLLGPGDEAILAAVEPEVFDEAVRAEWVATFLAEPTHHIAVARRAGSVIAFASAVRYLHPDKPPQLWINEVGVAPTYQRRGVGKRLMLALLDLAQETGCSEAWVLTERDNAAAQGLYRAAGGRDTGDGTVLFEFKV